MPHIPADTPESLLEAVKRKIEKIAGITVTHASGKLKWLRVHTEAKSTRAVRKLVELAERTNGVVTVYTNGPKFRHCFQITPAMVKRSKEEFAL